jgi:hypothetical protein
MPRYRDAGHLQLVGKQRLRVVVAVDGSQLWEYRGGVRNTSQWGDAGLLTTGVIIAYLEHAAGRERGFVGAAAAVTDVGAGACRWLVGAEYRSQGGSMDVSCVATRPPERQS